MVTSNVYRVAAAATRLYPPTESVVTDYLERQVADAVVQRIERNGHGLYEIDIEINSGSTHEDSLDDFISAAAQLGLHVAAAEVTEYSSAAIATAVGGALTGAGLGAAVASGVGAIAGALIGLVAGDLVGETRLRVVRRYNAQRDAYGSWSLSLRPVGFGESVGWAQS
jgi:hypothetical protein